MWKCTGVPRSHVHPLLTNPNATKPYYTMSVWHVEECRHTQFRCNPPPWPPLIPTTTQLYYMISVWHVGECRDIQVRSTPSTNWTQCCIALQHNVSLTCERMQMYPGQMYTSPLIELSATELYYTVSIWYLAECRCTQVRTFSHNTHVNWLKCFYVTTLFTWWLHVE